LYLSVDKKLVSQNAVAVRQIESQHAIVGVEVLVVEHHGDVEIREARKPKAGGFIAGVKLIEEQVETREALVNVLRREVYAVIVIQSVLIDSRISPVGGWLEAKPASTFG
jgi:hypothetical protein